MRDNDRYRLLGEYVAPTGDALFDVIAQEWVAVLGLTVTPMPWPYTRAHGPKARRIVTEELAAAIRRESQIAMAHWWGVTPMTVFRWRRLLKVPRLTEGTSRLFHDYGPEKSVALQQVRATSPDLWTPEEDAIALSHTAREAAAITGRSMRAVWQRLYHLRLKNV